jgi:hypothetical protein
VSFGYREYDVLLIPAFLRPEVVGARHTRFGMHSPRIHLHIYLDRLIDMLPIVWMREVPRSVALISPFIVMWDYKWLAIQRRPDFRVIGLWEYRQLQLIILVIRFLAWGMIRWIDDLVITMWTSGFLGLVSLFVRTFSHPLNI